MAVNQNRPYERHFVSNIPTLLPAGNTLAALGIGQLGIFDAKTNLSVTAPTYAANRAIYFAQGTPDRSAFPEGAMVPNMVRRSHTVQGKKLIQLRAAKASRGLGEIVTLGFDGVDTTKTLSAKPGQTFYYWVRLTGEPIFNLNPDRAKGVIIQGAVQMPCADECADNCTTVDCNVIADLIIDDWNGVPDGNVPGKIRGGKFLPGGQRANQYVQICKVDACDADPDFNTTDYDNCTLTIPDDGSQSALGVVQAQAGTGFIVTRTGRNGIFSTYETAPKAAPSACPAAFNQAAGTVIPDCDVCPVGTLTPASAEFTLKTDAVLSAGELTALNTVLSALSGETSHTVTLLQLDTLTNIATYTVKIVPADAAGADATTIDAAIIAAGTVTAYVSGSTTLVGITQPFCTLPADTIAWVDNGVVCVRVEVEFKLSLKDDVCGNTYLAELQAAYAEIAVDGGTVAGVVTVNEGSGCVHEYTLTTQSKNCIPDDCCAADVQFPDVPAFNGSEWVPQPLPEATPPCVCGVQFTSNFVPRKETECTFGNWARQVDWVHIEASSHNPDWRSTDLCETDPVATRIQNGKQPNGDGPYVVRLERQDRMYDMDYFYLSPVLREAFDYYFEARFDSFYDMVAVEYEFEYPSNNGFGQTDRDRYVQHFWLPETQATALVNALNTYAVSAGIDIDPIVY